MRPLICYQHFRKPSFLPTHTQISIKFHDSKKIDPTSISELPLSDDLKSQVSKLMNQQKYLERLMLAAQNVSNQS